MMFCVLFPLSVIQIHTVWPRCFWIQSCSHTTPLEKPFSFIFFEQLDLQKPYVIMVSCIVDEGTHWQPPPLYIPPAPLLNSLSCFLMVLHLFCVCFCSLFACVAYQPVWGCPMKWITKLACWLNAIETHSRCVACVIVNKDKLNL